MRKNRGANKKERSRRRRPTHLSPDKHEAPRTRSSPTREKSVSPQLAMSSPALIIPTTNTDFHVMTSNLNTTAQRRILRRGSSLEERDGWLVGCIQICVVQLHWWKFCASALYLVIRCPKSGSGDIARSY